MEKKVREISCLLVSENVNEKNTKELDVYAGVSIL